MPNKPYRRNYAPKKINQPLNQKQIRRKSSRTSQADIDEVLRRFQQADLSSHVAPKLPHPVPSRNIPAQNNASDRILNTSQPPLPQQESPSWWSRHPTLKGMIVGVTILLLLSLCPISFALFASSTHSTPQTNTIAQTKITATPTHKKQSIKKTTKVKASLKPAHRSHPTPIPHSTTPSQPVSQPTQPSVVPTPTPAPAPTSAAVSPPASSGVNGNPWGYDFNPGSVIYNPDPNFCSYFACIVSFWTNTRGYVEECVDGTYSHSGGRYGVCNDHGGPLRPLYSH